MFKKTVLLLGIFLVLSCSSSRSPIVTTKAGSSKYKKTNSSDKKGKSETIQSSSRTVVTSELITAYVFRYKDIAMKNMKKYGIPASIILAQGILESGSGQGDIAVTANNHFGIKCYKDWTGATIYHDDDSSQECFRKYNKAEDSYQDHADILSKRSRYASLFSLPKDDYKAWAKGLKIAGYATDPNYPEKLISYIERYHLDQYDAMVLEKKYDLEKNQNAVSQSKANVGAETTRYVVQQGDTLYSISKKFNIAIEELKRQNNIFDNAISIGQTILIK